MNNRTIAVAVQTAMVWMPIIRAENLVINESRPLGKLVSQLQSKYHYLVTYEEAPYSQHEVSLEVGPKGLPHRFPTYKAVTFHLPEQATAAPDLHQLPNRPEAVQPDLIKSLVGEYNQSGNPGHFDVLFDGDYAHVVPTLHMVDGRYEQFLPVLSTKVIIPPQTHSCYEVFTELFAQIKALRGFIVQGVMLPANPLQSPQCTIEGTDLTARQVLTATLRQVGANVIPGMQPTRFAWLLTHTPNDDVFFLQTWIVRNPNEASHDAAPAEPNPTEPQPPKTPATGLRWFDTTKPRTKK